jgi:hypothetical protein
VAFVFFILATLAVYASDRIDGTLERFVTTEGVGDAISSSAKAGLDGEVAVNGMAAISRAVTAGAYSYQIVVHGKDGNPAFNQTRRMTLLKIRKKLIHKA